MTANATQEKKDATQEAECTSFDALGLNQEIMGAVEELGYTAPTPVQAGAIPQVLEGRDVLAAALQPPHKRVRAKRQHFFCQP